MNCAPVFLAILHNCLLVYAAWVHVWTKFCNLYQNCPKISRETERDRERRREGEKERRKEGEKERKGTEPGPRRLPSRLLRLASGLEIEGASILDRLIVSNEAFYYGVEWGNAGSDWWGFVSSRQRAYWRPKDTSTKDEEGGASNQYGLGTYQLQHGSPSL